MLFFSLLFCLFSFFRGGGGAEWLGGWGEGVRAFLGDGEGMEWEERGMLNTAHLFSVSSVLFGIS